MSMTQPTMAGGAMAAGIAGRGIIRAVFSNPWVTLAIGVAAGYYGYKYRKEIVAAATKLRDAGQDFILEQRERLSDIVAETREAEEQKAGEPPGGA
jgi:hypothetical protein